MPTKIDADARQVLQLARRLGTLEAIETLAAALIEKLASDPETSAAELDALQAIREGAFNRRREGKPATA